MWRSQERERKRWKGKRGKKKQRRLESDYGDGRRIKKNCDQRREKSEYAR